MAAYTLLPRTLTIVNEWSMTNPLIDDKDGGEHDDDDDDDVNDNQFNRLRLTPTHTHTHTHILLTFLQDNV